MMLLFQGEIRSLRGEVAHLKKLLIAHKDCPVTLQQQSQGQILPQISKYKTFSHQSGVSRLYSRLLSVRDIVFMLSVHSFWNHVSVPIGQV